MLGCRRVTHVIDKKRSLTGECEGKSRENGSCVWNSYRKSVRDVEHPWASSEFRCIKLQLIASPGKVQRKAHAGSGGHT